MQLLLNIHNLWSIPPVSFDQVMLWAACCLGFFGFLRAGEFTCAQEEFLDPPLAASDVVVDSRTNPQLISVHLRQSKTDPFGVGCHIYLGRTNATPCPVAAILNYLSVRPPSPGPLFIFQDGKPLTRVALVDQLRSAMQQLGMDSSLYAGHSFRIRAATAAAKAGYPDSMIQTLGRWKSAAFLSYLRSSAEELAAVAPSPQPVLTLAVISYYFH